MDWQTFERVFGGTLFIISAGGLLIRNINWPYVRSKFRKMFNKKGW